MHARERASLRGVIRHRCRALDFDSAAGADSAYLGLALFVQYELGILTVRTLGEATMGTTKISGVIKTEIYQVEDGFLAIKQADNTVLLAPDELLTVIQALQVHYDRRAQWQEPTRG
jgi:hypothetical protein